VSRGMGEQRSRRILGDLIVRSIDIPFASSAKIMDVSQDAVVRTNVMKVSVAKRWTCRTSSRRVCIVEDDDLGLIWEVIPDIFSILGNWVDLEMPC
jgi:hypothetical protein